MGSRNAIDIYDPRLAHKQQMLAEPHKYSGGFSTGSAPKPPPLSPEIQKKLLEALAKEARKVQSREDERRKRDPTYKPNAIELSNANLLEFDKYFDYYEVLQVDQFASGHEIKAAYKKLSLELHPDKWQHSPSAEKVAAKEKFIHMKEAFAILSDLATRREYDKQRDNLDARVESGLQDIGKMERPPPTCVDIDVTLENLYRGVRKQVEFTRNEFAGTRYAKTSCDYYNVKINRGELEGATVWYRMAGDVGPVGRADLVFVVKQRPHEVFERLGDDLWYYEREAVEDDALFYVGWVPTLATTSSAEKHELHPTCRQVVAFGSTLP